MSSRITVLIPRGSAAERVGVAKVLVQDRPVLPRLRMASHAREIAVTV